MYILFFISLIILICGITIGIIGIINYRKDKSTIRNEIIFNLEQDQKGLLIKQEQLKKDINNLIEKKTSLQKDSDNLLTLLTKYREEGKSGIDKELSNFKKLGEERITHENQVREQQLVSEYWKQKAALETEYNKLKDLYLQKLDSLQTNIDDFQGRVDAINRAALRQKELMEQEDFYSIIIPENDRDDIQALQELQFKFNNKNIIPKLIWDVFVRRPVQEMTKRVLAGRESTSGIYKITNKQTGESYIGRSSNIGTRWQNHCKTAIGLESAASSTFHTRLAKDGIWNYTWEILEEVSKDKLGEREAFYIDLYGTKNQLNMKAGG